MDAGGRDVARTSDIILLVQRRRMEEGITTLYPSALNSNMKMMKFTSLIDSRIHIAMSKNS